MGLFASYFVPPNPATKPSNDSPLPNTNQAHGSSQSQSPSTPWTSRPSSFAPSAEIKDSSAELMDAHLHQQQVVNTWYDRDPYDEGVVVKKSKGEYICCPEGLMGVPDGFYVAVKALNVRAAITLSTQVIKIFLRDLDDPYIPLPGGLRLQVLPDFS